VQRLAPVVAVGFDVAPVPPEPALVWLDCPFGSPVLPVVACGLDDICPLPPLARPLPYGSVGSLSVAPLRTALAPPRPFPTGSAFGALSLSVTCQACALLANELDAVAAKAAPTTRAKKDLLLTLRVCFMAVPPPDASGSTFG